MDSTLSHLRPRLAGLAFAAGTALAGLPAAAANHELIVPPLAAGPFTVACSNIQQDPALIARSGLPATDFWEGKGGRYITEILPQGSSALRIDALVPDIRTLYPGNAGDRVAFVAIVCHPTPRANSDPDYVMPGAGTDVVPRMLPAGAQPRLLSAVEWGEAYGIDYSPPPPGPAKLPMIVYSHGLSGSPIGKGYINVMTQLAAHGYVVAAVFHGDPRFSRVRLEDFNDYFYALTQFDRVAEMMLMRPVSLKAMTDMLLSHAGYSPGIDAERIGGFGASMGGQAMINLLGARMTTSVGLACRETVRDPRIKAAVGYVPYAGQTFLPAFCEQQRGAEEVTRPYLAITGSADNTAPEKLAQQAVNLFKGSRYVVSLAGGEHELRPQDVGDLVTWMITFLDAYLDVPFRGYSAMSRLIRMAQVQGGREDSVEVDVHVPTSFNAAANERPAREFYNTVLNHYFMAASQGEIDLILAGVAGPGWVLTNEAFKVHTDIPPGPGARVVNPVCRFYGAPPKGPNSHFFTSEAGECELVKQIGDWAYEGIGFHVVPQAAGRCPSGFLEVRRAYNNRFSSNDSNHRYTTSDSTMREMSRRNWFVEGTVWCALP